MEEKTVNTTPFYVIERHFKSELVYWSILQLSEWSSCIDDAVKFWNSDSANTILKSQLGGFGNVVEHAYVDVNMEAKGKRQKAKDRKNG
jgi:hypothetical protein